MGFTVAVLFVWVIVPVLAAFLPGQLVAAGDELKRSLYALSPFATAAVAIAISGAAASAPHPMSLVSWPLALDAAVAALGLWLAWRARRSCVRASLDHVA